MSDNETSGVNPLDMLAEEFVTRYRRGENPSVSEYAAKYPELADDVRELFPGLLLMEGVRPDVSATTGPFLSPAAKPALERLGDYRILREVGHGGMGVVYEAEQMSLGRHVALKVLPASGLMNPTFLERFRREAKAAARLHHTNIVPVYGVGEADGVHFYAMQFIQGQSLDQVLHDLRRLRKRSGSVSGFCTPLGADFERSVAHGLLLGQLDTLPANPNVGQGAPGESTPQPVSFSVDPAATGGGSSTGLSAGGSEAQYFRSVARIGLQVADALAYAHRQGVLHRDVKPSNLLLDQQGIVWITDFGLSKAEGSDELTQSGEIVGTMRFMAPERFEGNSLPQSDVYSLGLTLYEMLTLRPAFHDTNKARLIEKLLHQPPLPPRRIDPHIPRDLETIILKCVAKDPASRYATPEALAEDLRRFLSDRPVRARRASHAERTWRWCRRNPAVASLLAAVLLLLAAVAVVSTFSAARLRSALTRTEEAEREARLRESEALVGEAHGIRYSRRPGQRFEALAALEKAAAIGHELKQPPAWFDRLRNEAIAALALPDIHITQKFGSLPPGTYYAEVSCDFELYARTTQQGACSVRRIADDSVVAAFPEWGETVHADFGPGRLLLLHGQSSGRCQLWDLAKPEPAPLLDERHAVATWRFRRDSRLLALGHRDGFISVYATDSGKRRHYLAPKGIVGDPGPCLHPTEPFIAVSSYWSNLLQVRDPRTGAVLVALTLPWRGSGSCAWSPDGRTLAVSHGDGVVVHLYAFDPTSPALRLSRTLRGSGAGATVHFNPAGDRLAARGWDNAVRVFDAITGRLLFSIPPLPSSAYTPLRFDSTGERLAAARVGPLQRQIGVWSVADAREYRPLVHDGPERDYSESLHAIHPGGRLAALGLTGGLALFDLETGRELAFVRVPGRVGGACFDDKGNLFINSYAGLFRWPVHPDSTQPGRLTIGPPERLPFRPDNRCIAASRDGWVIAQAHFGLGGWVLHPKVSQAHRVETVRCNWCSVSPDGLWAAFGPHTDRVNVYEAATGRRVWRSPQDGHVYSRFSPDGRWLITGNDGGRAWTVGTWVPGPQLGPGTPWDVSPDSSVAVLGLSDGIYRLVELATGRELARLEDPEQIAAPAVFTPDGTRLIVAAADGLRVWDLRRIRRELAKLGLDWDAPPCPETASGVPEPLEVKVVGAESLIPRDPVQLNNIAWRLATGPANQRDPAQALKLIQDALKMQPDKPMFLNTLGVVQYRNVQYAAAIVSLEKSLRLSKGEFAAFDLFFLAMCHAKLSAPDKAKDCFDRAVKWTDGKKDLSPLHTEELKAFREEAKTVLGVK
jgi:serine/threonine protein kinase/WD40 repeat protein